ncbi:hypothetical protein B0T16DRAFT_372504 [Cercophora newfieldiana]|uniref:RecQ-mediated genome instability protein 1 n=1 Tax=Cercophora newfieldiana TaxID=92897 RepID=A0AA40CSC9_9PEZI|nr:hypothetical protein B0T16DRAFT_372504 [Cercophora newfieldiana]
MADLPTQLQNALRSHTLPHPSRPWLRALIPSRIPPPPIASLIATARARLLASDLTTPGLLDPAYAAEHALPSALVNNPEIDTGRLPRDVVVQVVDIENLSRSRWEQVEELEAIERGEQTRGREVVRIAEREGEGEGEGGQNGGGNGGGNQNGSAAAKATHKLVLQDCKGEKVIGIELKRVEQIAIGKTNIGEKMMLKRDAKIARGVVLLEPTYCHVLGGKVDAWHKVWLDGRLAKLKEAAGVADGR